ncbi:F510_1955 family glycosylhydrolase [Arthrobacter sp. TB 23]|uniref:F510_1955 family glycosylhydrolase n=1 Tax=Arthrobacter sp. TB 23 TaxID=494419 RepID=UPI0002E4A84A|nr:hypothetical protein [Arthrobacter sp. TB 23]
MLPKTLPGNNKKVRTAALGLTTVFFLAACGQQASSQAEETPHNDETPHTDESPHATENPFGHVHGLTFNEDRDQLLLATHNGLFDVGADPIEKLGSTLDLMGFAGAGPDLYYASGHPGPGSDLPNPMGLIESTDGGETWQELSRQGESDFHTLTVSEAGVIGFDGTLRLTTDGKEWSETETQIQPANLSASLDGPIVLATTEDGVQRSTDGGMTWTLPPESPILLQTTFADKDTVVGATPDGAIHISQDAGQTWVETGGSTAQPSAIAAAIEEDELRIWVSTEKGIEFSDDNGASFTTTVQAGQ